MPDTPRVPQQRPGGIILAFDFGLRRIGIAAGNDITRSATALRTLPTVGDEAPWAAIDALVAEWTPKLLVVGQPGESGGSSIAPQVAAFSAALAQRYGLPVAHVDETLTSSAAAAELADARRTGNRKRRVTKGTIDSHAARLIAEQYLNSA